MRYVPPVLHDGLRYALADPREQSDSKRCQSWNHHTIDTNMALESRWSFTISHPSPRASPIQTLHLQSPPAKTRLLTNPPPLRSLQHAALQTNHPQPQTANTATQRAILIPSPEQSTSSRPHTAGSGVIATATKLRGQACRWGIRAGEAELGAKA